MKKAMKIWLVTAAALILVGATLFAGVMFSLDWDFYKLSSVDYETNTYYIDEDFDSVSIDVDTSDIIFLKSDDDTCKVVCYEQEKINSSVFVEDGKLIIKSEDERRWYEYFKINLRTQKIMVYLSKNSYDSIVIKTSTGDINIKEILADTVDIKVTTGDVSLTDISCRKVVTSGSTGDVTFKNIVAEELIKITRSTGDIDLKSSDAGEISIKTSAGDIKGSLLTGKEFKAKTNTGDVKVPKSSVGGKCQIITNTGDIKFSVK